MKQDFLLYLRETNKCYELLKENGEFELLPVGQLLYEIATINLDPVVNAIRNFSDYEPNQRNYNVSSIVNAIIGSVCFAYTEIQLRLLRIILDKFICEFRPSSFSFDDVATNILSEQEKIIKYYNLLKSVPINADAIYNFFLCEETYDQDYDCDDCDYYDYNDYEELTENFAFIQTKSILHVKRDPSTNAVVIDELIEIGHWECILEVELKNICKYLEEYKLSGCSISILDWLKQNNDNSASMNFF